MKWALLTGAIASEVIASLSLKASLENRMFLVAVVVGYATAFVLLSAVLRRGLALGVAYGIWAAAGVALTTLFAALLFQEPLTPVMLAGIALIIVGVLCVELGSHSTGEIKEVSLP